MLPTNRNCKVFCPPVWDELLLQLCQVSALDELSQLEEEMRENKREVSLPIPVSQNNTELLASCCCC